MDKTLKIRPYARLLTMLGEQLIKNEQIALAELIKNSYDADADWVKVSFTGFGENFEITDQSKIIIEDNGDGMSIDTIEKSWMNPATPNKLAKDGTERKTKSKKRTIQGEKGIGRFAILKLGRKIKITTRESNSNEEIVIDYDLSAYDDNFLTENRNEKELFIDDINIRVFSQIPKEIVNREVKVNHIIFKNNNSKGTRVEISSLKGSWSDN
jgi:HSP90 family molecular chaperone